MIVLHAAQRATFVDWNPTGGIITILQHRCSGPVPMTQQLIFPFRTPLDTGTQLAVTTETDVLLVDRDVWTAAKPLLANVRTPFLSGQPIGSRKG